VYLARQTFQLTNEEQNKKDSEKNNRVLPLKKKKIFFFHSLNHSTIGLAITDLAKRIKPA